MKNAEKVVRPQIVLIAHWKYAAVGVMLLAEKDNLKSFEIYASIPANIQ